MLRFPLILILVCCCLASGAQELFVFTEPASLMPAKSLTVKVGSRFPDSKSNSLFKQRYIPEVMVGVSKKLMFHISSTLSDFYTPSVRYESTKLYGQWRFFASDDVHRHFRMALFAEGAITRNPDYYEELNLDGDHSGVQGGLIATQLIHKLALSGSFGATRIVRSNNDSTWPQGRSKAAFNYSLSAGYLLFPRQYTSYRQVNLNLYVELLGMKTLQQRGGMIDLAPALQLIVNSSYKFNAGYRFQLTGNMIRVGERTVYLGVEKTFLGILHKK